MIILLELFVYLFRVKMLVGILLFELIGFNQVHLVVLVRFRYFGTWKLFGLYLVQEVTELGRHVVSRPVGAQARAVLSGIVHHLAVHLRRFLDVQAFLSAQDIKFACVVKRR